MLRKKTTNILTQTLNTVRPVFLHMALFSFFINLLLLLVPIYSLQVLDRVLSTGSVETLFWLSFVVMLAFLASAVLQALRSFAMIRASEWMEEALSKSLLSMSLSTAAYTGLRGTQNLRDLTAIRNFLTGNGLITLLDAPWSIIYLFVVFLIHWSLGMITLFGCLALLVLAWLNELAMHKPLDEANEANVRNLTQVDIAMRNAEVIEAMGMTGTIADRWRRENEKVMALQSRASYRSSAVQAMTKFVRLFLQITIMGWGAYLALDQSITSGAIIAASILTARALAPFEAAITTWKMLVEARKSYHRLHDVIEAMGTREAGISLPEPEGRVSVDKLVYVPPGRGKPVLKGISFELDVGDILGVVGPSAAGKSTLSKLLVGAWRPVGGVVRLDGADVCQWKREEFGRHVGYLPQDVELFSGTVRDNIARMLPNVSDAAIIKAAQLANAHELIMLLPEGYDTDIGPGGAALSAGQRQRIGLARAFFGAPKLLVLDEPDANLDSEGEAALIQGLKNARERRITTVIVTHRRFLLNYVTKLMVMKDGMISMFGPTREVAAALMPQENKLPRNEKPRTAKPKPGNPPQLGEQSRGTP